MSMTNKKAQNLKRKGRLNRLVCFVIEVIRCHRFFLQESYSYSGTAFIRHPLKWLCAYCRFMWSSIMDARVFFMALVLFLSSCVSYPAKSPEPWSFPDSKYRTVHYRADQGKWKVWQYQETLREAKHHRAFMADFFQWPENHPWLAIERNANVQKAKP